MTTLLALAVLALASVTAYFAVFGLAALAPTVPYSMIALGLSLEFGKYVSLTYVYAHWSTLPLRLKVTTSTVLGAVLLLTSIGVFGYLQSAFSSSLANTEVQASALADTQKRVAALDEELKLIDAETKRVPDNAVRSRIALLREYEERRKPITEELKTLRTRESELKTKVMETRAHTGPLSYVASALDVPIDRAVFWMAVLLTVSLDPMAICLSLLLVYARNKPKEVLPVGPEPLPADPEIPETYRYTVTAVQEDGTEIPLPTVPPIVVNTGATHEHPTVVSEAVAAAPVGSHDSSSVAEVHTAVETKEDRQAPQVVADAAPQIVLPEVPEIVIPETPQIVHQRSALGTLLPNDRTT